MANAKEDRVILITGSSSGLGAALIENFAKKGFGAVINYIIEDEAQELFDRLAKEVDESKLMKYKADVANREQVRAMFDAVIEKFGRIDILVNTAGINRERGELGYAECDPTLGQLRCLEFECGDVASQIVHPKVDSSKVSARQ